MASFTKATSGAVTTYTITDAAGATGTLAVTVGPVTGNTVAMASTALHGDGMEVVAQLMLQLGTGLVP